MRDSTPQPVTESMYVRVGDASETSTIPAQKKGRWWKIPLAFMLCALLAAGGLYLFLSEADPDGTQAATKAVVARDDAEEPPKPDAQRAEALRKQNDAYCASAENDPLKTEIKRFYCASYLPESRKVDERLARLEEHAKSCDGHSHSTLWIIIGLIGACLIGCMIKISQKQERRPL